MKFSALVLLSVNIPLWRPCGAAFLGAQSNQLAMVQEHPRCDPDQNAKIDQAFQQFQLLTQGMEKWYNAATANPPLADAQKTLKRWFGDPAKATPHFAGQVNQILDQLIAVGRGHPQPTFMCRGLNGVDANSECRTTERAFTPPKESVVNLCPIFFTSLTWNFASIKDQADPEPQLAAMTIVHELTHSNVLMGRQDLPIANGFNPHEVRAGLFPEVYGRKECEDLAKGDVTDARKNADNYKWYTLDAYRLYCCSATLDVVNKVPNAVKQAICGASGIVVGQRSEACLIQ